MGCFSPFTKWVLFSFNCLFFLIGISLITVGAICTHTMKDLGKAIPSSYANLMSVPVTLLVLGSIILLVSLFGTYGVFKKNIFLLVTYTITLIGIFVLQIILSIAIFWTISDQQTLAAKVNTTVDDTFKNYNENKDFIDFMQMKLDCCGTTGPNFWINKGLKIPESCYMEGYSSQVTNKHGCQNGLYMFLDRTVKIAGTSILAVSPILVLGAVFSLSMVNTIRNNIRRYGKYGA